MKNESKDKFGYVPSENKGSVHRCDVDKLAEGFRNPRNAAVMAEIDKLRRQLEAGELTEKAFKDRKNQAKKQADACTFQGYNPTGQRRLRAEMAPTGHAMIDLDGLDNPDEVYTRCIQPLVERGIVWLCHVTPSRRGLRCVFRLPAGMDIARAQRWLYDQIDVPESCKDKCVKDLTRMSYFVPEDYLRHPATADGLKEALAKAIVPTATAVSTVSTVSTAPSPAPEAAGAEPEEAGLAFKGVPYARIVEQLETQKGGKPREGERNVFVYDLTRTLAAITDADPQLLQRIVPAYGLERAEWAATIESACKSDSRFFITRELKQVLEQLGVNVREAAAQALWKEPAMPARLPRLMKLLLGNTPDFYKPAVAQAVFPALATYLDQVSYTYIDGRSMESALMCVLIAPTGSGKSCVDDVISHIIADLMARDAVNRQAEEDWKADCAALGANQQRQKRQQWPIQCVQPDMTSAALLQRMSDAGGRFLFTQMDEIESLNKLGDNKFLVVKYAFDQSMFGAERVGEKSVSKVCRTRYNFVAATTPGRAHDYFAKVLTDGPVSRVNFCSIAEREIGAPIPVFGKYTAKFDKDLAPFLRNLEKATGHVQCRQALELARSLSQELADNAVAMQDRVYENLSFRANVIGYRKAMVLWLANGCKWEPAIADFVRWSVHYDLYCKMCFFGHSIRKAETNDAKVSTHRGPCNLLERLPDTFSPDDLKKLRAEMRMSVDAIALAKLLNTWKSRKLIGQPDPLKESYTKLKYRTGDNNGHSETVSTVSGGI